MSSRKRSKYIGEGESEEEGTREGPKEVKTSEREGSVLMQGDAYCAVHCSVGDWDMIGEERRQHQLSFGFFFLSDSEKELIWTGDRD